MEKFLRSLIKTEYKYISVDMECKKNGGFGSFIVAQPSLDTSRCCKLHKNNIL